MMSLQLSTPAAITQVSVSDIEKRPKHEGREMIWLIAARRSRYKRLSKCSTLYKAKRKIEKLKAQVRTKV